MITMVFPAKCPSPAFSVIIPMKYVWIFLKPIQYFRISDETIIRNTEQGVRAYLRFSFAGLLSPLNLSVRSTTRLRLRWTAIYVHSAASCVFDGENVAQRHETDGAASKRCAGPNKKIQGTDSHPANDVSCHHGSFCILRASRRAWVANTTGMNSGMWSGKPNTLSTALFV